AVGVVDRPKIIDGKQIVPGDVIIGLASSGVHSNGFSLVRKVLLERSRLTVETVMPELGGPLGETLLTPTRIYAKQVLSLMECCPIKGIAHITGGGITDNLPRVFPARCGARIRRGSWPVLPIFEAIQARGSVPLDEMYRVFNMGIGLILVVAPDHADRVMAKARELGEQAYHIGEMVAQQTDEGVVEYVG
ncbi:MAG TPA: phosphoribosylformylglycinamidine cyclo-ligase, partial [Nitrospira sp.]|nr:phosphoribosylformylglycinamidine cyclo-ligase [Nitrospira sp.]